MASVLGDYSDAKRIINSRSSCIGIDYLPPTPAPVQHVIGGEDDEPVETNAHSVNGNASDSDPNRPHKRPASFPRPQNTQRLPDNINQPHRPQAKPSRPTPDLFPPHASNGFANMALAPAPGNHHKTSRMPNQPNQPSPNWSRAMGTSPGGSSHSSSRMKHASQSLQKIKTDVSSFLLASEGFYYLLSTKASSSMSNTCCVAQVRNNLILLNPSFTYTTTCLLSSSCPLLTMPILRR